MSEQRDGYDVKRCVRCAAWIPSSAERCAACEAPQTGEAAQGGGATAPARRLNINVTAVLIWANVLFYLWSLWVDSNLPGSDRTVLARLLAGPSSRGLRPAGWYEHAYIDQGQYWRAVTFCFLHGNALHIGMNMYALKSLGHFCEEYFGKARFLVMYLSCGVISGLGVSLWYSGIQGQAARDIMPVVGASGAVFGLGGVLVVFLLRHGSVHGRAMAKMLAINLGAILAIGIMGLIPNMSNTGHVAGLLPGLVFGLLVAEQFADRLNPRKQRFWDLLAAVTLALVVTALAFGMYYAFSDLAGRPR